jgi:hypothetical protein
MLVQRGVHGTDETDIIRKPGAGQPREDIGGVLIEFYGLHHFTGPDLARKSGM